jgi:hypothetical protein
MSTVSRLFLSLGAAAALAGCAAQQPAPRVEMSAAGLELVASKTFDDVWVRPGTDLGAYRELVLDSARLEYRDVDERLGIYSLRLRPGHDAYPIPEDQRARMDATFERSLAEALDESTHYRRVEEHGSSTLAVRAMLVDFVSRVPAQEPFADSWVRSVGEGTLIVELWDPGQDALLVRALDHRKDARAPGRDLVRANQVASWPELSRHMQLWAGQTRMLIDELYRHTAVHEAGGDSLRGQRVR